MLESGDVFFIQDVITKGRVLKLKEKAKNNKEK